VYIHLDHTTFVRYWWKLYFFAIVSVFIISCEKSNSSDEARQAKSCADIQIPPGMDEYFENWKLTFEKYCDKKYGYFTQHYFDSILLENKSNVLFKCFYKGMTIDEFNLVLFRLGEQHGIRLTQNFDLVMGDVCYVYTLELEHSATETIREYLKIEGIAKNDTLRSIFLSTKDMREEQFSKVLALYKKKYKETYYESPQKDYYKWITDNGQVILRYNRNLIGYDIAVHPFSIRYDTYIDSAKSHDLKYLKSKTSLPKKELTDQI